MKWPVTLKLTLKPLNERQAVTFAIFLLAAGMFMMARENPDLWDIELFKIILQAVVISGIIGSIIAFHFAANKSDEVKANNTAKAFDAIAAVTASAPPVADVVGDAAHEVAEAAVTKAGEIASKP